MTPAATRFLLWLCLFGLLPAAGCGPGEPFDYIQASGRITYEDGEPIPIDPLVLTFYPQSEALDAKTHPRPGMVVASLDDGTFDEITSHRAGDGLVRGVHKVTLTDLNGQPLDEKWVPRDYSLPESTPLEVDTATEPFHLKVRRP